MDALLCVDIQHDFLPGGALAVPRGDEVIPALNTLIPAAPFVVATQDWHPHDHGSFAEQHADRAIGDVIDLDGIDQILWPTHCVQGTHGAELTPLLSLPANAPIVHKGTNPRIDSYSAFFDNGHRQETALRRILDDHGVTRVLIGGLATDYCVKFTALDAIGCGYETVVVEDACRGVDLADGDCARALDEMQAAGVAVVGLLEAFQGLG